jgi:hypothetical protein
MKANDASLINRDDDHSKAHPGREGYLIGLGPR